MGLMDCVSGIFTHRYDIRATVELDNGEIYKLKVPIEARFVTREEFITKAKFLINRECEWKLNSGVKRYIDFYDASNV